MVVAGELPDTPITTMADRASVLAMVADTGDMAMDMDTDMAMDMAIDVGDLGASAPSSFMENCPAPPVRRQADRAVAAVLKRLEPSSVLYVTSLSMHESLDASFQLLNWVK